MSSPDSLQILLQKARAIHAVNEENIAHIQSRKGQKVIVKHRYALQTQNKTQNERPTTEKVDNRSTKNVDDIIAVWRYQFDDLVRKIINMVRSWTSTHKC